MSDDTTMPNSPAAQLAAIKAERARLAEEREARDAATAVERELEEEKRKLVEDKAIDQAIETHGALDKKIAVVDTVVGRVIVKKPNHVLFKRFQDSGETTVEEFTKLVRPCVVYPDKAAFDTLLEENGGILGQLANAVARLAGVKLKEVSAK